MITTNFDEKWKWFFDLTFYKMIGVNLNQYKKNYSLYVRIQEMIY